MCSKRIIIGILTILPVFLGADRSASQVPSPSPFESDVVKISTKLVQVDLVVVDKDRNGVATLRRDDFEVFQDGKLQSITNFNYVKRRLDTEVPVQRAPDGKGPIQFPPPIKLKPDDVGRVITFVVSCYSYPGRVAAREAIEKFLSEQMLPNDLVAIHVAGSGTSRLQQYTNDRQMLYSSAGLIGRMPRLASPGDDILSAGTGKSETTEETRIREKREASANDLRYLGQIGTVNSAVTQMRAFRGRKFVFLISEGLSLRSANGISGDLIKALRDVTDVAIRSGVVINTIDARGVANPAWIDVGQQVSVASDVMATDKIINPRWVGDRSSQDGLIAMAEDTGGRYYQNQNYLDTSLKEALKPETGYYLIGYEPDESSFKGKKFNKITVRVKIRGLSVIYRPGYLAEPDPELINSPMFAGGESVETPWSRQSLEIGLTAIPESTADGHTFVRTLLHIAGDEIGFTDEADGNKKAVLDVMAVTVDERNRIIDQFNRTHTLRFDPVTAERIKKRGLVYSADVPVKKAGNYNFFVIVRDVTSKISGTASQIMNVPDIKGSGLSLSSIVVSGVGEDGKFEKPGPTTAENAVSVPNSSAVPAIRRFTRGTVIAYQYSIHNARIDRGTGRPRLTIQLNLYKDGKLVVQGDVTSVKAEGRTGPSRIDDFGFMRLSQTEAGEYALQLVVRDTVAGKGAIASQWIDFDVVE